MSKNSNKRRQFFANSFHREMCALVFFAMFVPTTITAIGLFYLIFNITAEQAGFPETIAYTLIPAAKRVIGILIVTVPFVVAGILLFAYKVTHRLVGPYDRIMREMGQNIRGERKGPIKLRGKDKFTQLVDLINQLLEKI
ncbi:MAG: hypothetical protein KAR05_01930 [Candidatus Omnitrophica bacterium]|nr:hypothetical protein [Candidatus Omnitrophota bacterium]